MYLPVDEVIDIAIQIAQGLAGKAIEQYEKFLEIWKDADEDLPELIDARARLASLGSGIN